VDDHFVRPTNAEESKLVEDRILGLTDAVLTPDEWLGLLSAAETLLPRKRGKLVAASDLDLASLGARPSMSLYRAILLAVGARGTYNANQRYRLSDWVAIARNFSVLSMYVVPPPGLAYAVQLCRAAIAASDVLDSVLVVNILSEIDIRVVRQLVSAKKMEEWSDSLTDRLREKCGEGEDIERSNDDRDSYDPDRYDDWLAGAERLIPIARDFYQWSGLQEPAELRDLGHLTDVVEKPRDPEPDDLDDSEYVRDPGPSNYWTLEKIFEDLR